MHSGRDLTRWRSSLLSLWKWVLIDRQLSCSLQSQFCCKPHFSSLLQLNLNDNKNPSPQSKNLHFCKLGLLPQALKLLNSTNPCSLSIKPNIYASLLQTCIQALSFTHDLQIHSHVIKSGLDSDRFVSNNLLSMYFKLCPDFSQTRLVFDNLYIRDVISWTSMVLGYVRKGKPEEPLKIFREMLDLGVEFNGSTLSAIIEACSELETLRIGRCFHGIVLSRGFDSNYVIASALIDIYGRSLEVEDARKVFDEMLEPDAICWTSVISTYTRCDGRAVTASCNSGGGLSKPISIKAASCSAICVRSRPLRIAYSMLFDLEKHFEEEVERLKIAEPQI